MAKSDDLLSRLQGSGLRKKVAQTLADAVGSGSRRATPPKVVRDAVKDLRQLASELEDRATGGSSKRKAAAKKAAATRKRNESKRSASAKKAAATRAKNERATGKPKRAAKKPAAKKRAAKKAAARKR